MRAYDLSGLVQKVFKKDLWKIENWWLATGIVAPPQAATATEHAFGGRSEEAGAIAEVRIARCPLRQQRAVAQKIEKNQKKKVCVQITYIVLY